MIASLAAAEAALSRLAARPAAATAALILLCLTLWLPGFAGFPVTDRDEALFAQSSRQMAETGDLLRIRFLDEARLNKPVGIYWLQAAAVTLTTGPEAGAIWPYRLPSLLAAIAAVLLTRAIALRLGLGAGAALAAAALLAASLVLGGEARLAKTDAALLAATVGAMAVLAGLWRDRPARLGPGALGGFWVCLAAAVLLKGPVGPLVVLLAALTLAGMERRAGWLRPLGRWPGPVLFLALVLPWYAAITAVEGAAFWQASLGRDLLGKVAEGQEAHGAPPGAYLATLPLGFWPGAGVLALALPGLWRGWRAPPLRFALAWAVPFWLVLEATPTKLLHYPLPVYPAFAIAGAAVWAAMPAPGRWGAVALALLGALGLALPVAAIGLGLSLGTGGAALPIALAAGGAIALIAALGAARAAAPLATVAALCAMAACGQAALLAALGRTPALWSAAAVAQAVAAAPACPGATLHVAGFREPSLAFRSPLPPRFTTAEAAARALAASPCALAAVEARAMPAFAAAGPPPTRTLAEVDGFALGSGRWVRVRLLAPAG